MAQNLQITRIGLPTGVTLTVQLGGPEDAEPILLLHGFPESHRTWRKIAPALSDQYRVVAPDQRGFGGSDKPEGVEHYRTDRVLSDLVALADSLKLPRFTLVGHDWGGAIAWAAALRHPDLLSRLVIVNAPHPLLFQKSLVDDRPQRTASQYIRALRSPLMEAGIRAMGLEAFFEKMFSAHVDRAQITATEKEAYLEEWSQEGALTSMLNWYRASDIEVPEIDEEASPPLWTRMPFPKVKVPTLVIWALQDRALLPVQLEGLDGLVEDLRVLTIRDCGHFVPWERPGDVIEGIRNFIAATPLRDEGMRGR